MPDLSALAVSSLPSRAPTNKPIPLVGFLNIHISFVALGAWGLCVVVFLFLVRKAESCHLPVWPPGRVTWEKLSGVFLAEHTKPLPPSPLCTVTGFGELSHTAGQQPLPKPLFDPCLDSFLIMNCSPDLRPALGAISPVCAPPWENGLSPRAPPARFRAGRFA